LTLKMAGKPKQQLLNLYKNGAKQRVTAKRK
jgi:hypothetical protein